MASSASGQDEPNRALWLATRVGKIEPSCPLGTTRCIPQAKFPQKPYNKSFLDQVSSVKMAGYWPRSFLARSINKQKKNLANIQPSWPDTWSITHAYCLFFGRNKILQRSLISQIFYLANSLPRSMKVKREWRHNPLHTHVIHGRPSI